MWRRIVRRVLGPPIRIPIVYYHEIGPEVSKHAVHPDAFADQVRWLIDTGFNVLSMDDLVRVYTGKRAAPARVGSGSRHSTGMTRFLWLRTQLPWSCFMPTR